ncbi:bifunctional 2-polyprenyl-6-hydroxyphenol methylase/3-demethylubiquinol 3-O-methyltransferase UbiG [uncultured Aeromicrobium sp.]|uniref:class I SAM-dependent methyltransferase n=1 Tax=uncultured Aeromicrobium sp. TaxID=337820 RepID=UPI0025D9FF63|nr:methyltransferase [uncultured Aeromicrobium sp.]
MGPVRGEVMWQAVRDAVDVASAGSSRVLRVLDLGGGTGSDAVRVAQAGHEVTVVDPSPDALAALARRADEAGAQIRHVLGDTGDLGDHVPAGSVDLVLCHGVLEHVEDPGAALTAVAGTLVPAGLVSVVVAGRVGGALVRAIAGDFAGALALVERPLDEWDVRDHGPRRFFAGELDDLLAAHGFVPGPTRGLRVFADLVPSSVVDMEPGAREALFALEQSARSRRDFTTCSGGLQQIARLESK